MTEQTIIDDIAGQDSVESIGIIMQRTSLTPPTSPEEETKIDSENEIDCCCPTEAAHNVAITLCLSKEKEMHLKAVLNRSGPCAATTDYVAATTSWPPVNPEDVLDAIATWNYNGRRDSWDGGHRWMFHFKDLHEIVQCKKDIGRMYPDCFGISNAAILRGRGEPNDAKYVLTDVMVINKTASRSDDVFPFHFFDACVTILSLMTSEMRH